MLVNLPQAVKEASTKAESLEAMTRADVRWSPSVVLADYLARRLRQGGMPEVTMIDTPQAFPGIEHRERTGLLLNWWIPIRDKWYNVEKSPIDYSELATTRGIHVVLEAAVAGYSVHNDASISSDIFLKMSDPSTGTLLARTRQFNANCGMVSPPSGGEELRGAFRVCLEALGDKALDKIGLLRTR